LRFALAAPFPERETQAESSMVPTDPNLRSFIPVAADWHFPIQNLPYGMFYRQADGLPRVGVAIGAMVLDLQILAERGLLDGPTLGKRFFVRQRSLNDFMSRGPEAWREARRLVTRLLSADEPTLGDDVILRDRALVPMADVAMLMPVEIGDYTDF
jgi:fumarylacetoacetase